MKYSLRSLIVVMLVAGIVCGRIAHLKRWADYHQSEAERLVSEKLANGRWTREYLNELIELKKDAPQKTDYWVIAHHRQLAKEYRAAMCRPWVIVEEKRFPNDAYEPPEKLRSAP